MIDYKVSEGNWRKVEILDNLGEMVWIQYLANDVKNVPWVHFDSDRFAKKNSESEENKYNSEFYIYDKVQR